jgi:hypothetical protein
MSSAAAVSRESCRAFALTEKSPPPKGAFWMLSGAFGALFVSIVFEMLVWVLVTTDSVKLLDDMIYYAVIKDTKGIFLGDEG